MPRRMHFIITHTYLETEASMQNDQMRRLGFAATIVLGLLAIGCPSPPGVTPTPQDAPAPHPAIATMKVRYLEQGWSLEERNGFHYTPQGSEIIPYYWFLSLEEPHSTALFKEGLKKY